MWHLQKGNAGFLHKECQLYSRKRKQNIYPWLHHFVCAQDDETDCSLTRTYKGPAKDLIQQFLSYDSCRNSDKVFMITMIRIVIIKKCISLHISNENFEMCLQFLLSFSGM